jgi:hypothetical protein
MKWPVQVSVSCGKIFIGARAIAGSAEFGINGTGLSATVFLGVQQFCTGLNPLDLNSPL